MAKPMSFGVAVNAELGTFPVGNRHFKNRCLSIAEQASIAVLEQDLPVVAAGLTLLKNEGEEVTTEWLAANVQALPPFPQLPNELRKLYYYMVGGEPAVQAYLDALKKEHG